MPVKKSTTKSRTQNEAIESLDEIAEQQKISAYDLTTIEYDDNKTRHQIAKTFVLIYFCLLGMIIIGTPIYNLIAYNYTKDESVLQLTLTDLIQTYSAVVGPTLGFVVAYYFKTRDK